MTTAALASALHVLAIAMVAAAMIGRERAMTASLAGAPLDGLFRADNWSGVGSLLLMGSGLWRWLGGLEKPSSWYLQDHFFVVKLALLGVAWVLEMWPMLTFIRWRTQLARGGTPDTSRLPLLRRINRVELGLMLAMIFVAPLMARGVWHAAAPSVACRVADQVAARCLTCHGAAAPQGRLVLAGDWHGALVDVPSPTWPDQRRVVPGDPARSLLWRKLAGEQAPHGAAMPLGQPVDPALAAAVHEWIVAGAPACSER